VLATSLKRTLTLIALIAGLLLAVAAPQALARDTPPAANAKSKLRLKVASPGFDNPVSHGEWIADLERPAEQFRGRYGRRLAEARTLLG
jgi:hypothetical protein